MDENNILPFITPMELNISGNIKTDASHFIVDEIPVYEPCGAGEHLYVNFTREGITTSQLRKDFARVLKVKEMDIGYAGMKDKKARATQSFSILIKGITDNEAQKKLEGELPITVNYVKRHNNKLRIGHLLGNRFSVILATSQTNAMNMAEDIYNSLHKSGLPNYYGIQRFGVNGDNAKKGRDLLLSGKKQGKPWLTGLLLSSYLSALFNEYLAQRIKKGFFEVLFNGDIAKKLDTGGLFEVTDADVDSIRFANRQITYTGPIYGAKMTWAKGIPGEIEQSIFDKEGISQQALKYAKLDGSRRPARIFMDNISISPCQEGLIFNFSLPKGAYATNVIREFVKSELEIEDTSGD